MIPNALFHATIASIFNGAVYRTKAKPGAPLPRAVFQQVGGMPINFYDQRTTPPSMANARIQLVVWALTVDEAMNKIKACHDALIAVAALHTHVLSMPAARYEEKAGPNGADLHGAMQDFSVWT